MFSGTQNPQENSEGGQAGSLLPAGASDVQVPSRGGRPSLPRQQRRTYRIGVSLSEAEREVIAAKAEATGLRPAVYLRGAGLGARLSARVNDRAYHQLSRIGVNVNQLARATNRTGHLPELEVLYAILAEVRELRDRI